MRMFARRWLPLTLCWLSATIFSGGALAQTRRLPAPEAAATDSAKAGVRESLKAQLAKARAPAELKPIISKLISDARDPKADATERFALLAVARELASSAGDWELGIEAVVQTATVFELDPFVLADELRGKIDSGDRPASDPKAAFGETVRMVENAMAKDRYDIAERFANSAQRIARRAGDKLSESQIAGRLQELRNISKQYDAIKPTLATLEKNPVDPAANQKAGEFRCFVQGRWDVGLCLLALGTDAELSRLAEEELRQQTLSKELLKVADDWWQLASNRRADQKALRRHAVDCYLRVLPVLVGAEDKAARARLTEAEKWHSKDAMYQLSPSTSTFDQKHPPLPTLLNAVDRFYKEPNGAEFAFHITDPNAFIVIDLKKETPISRIEILNSTGVTTARARGIKVFLSSSPDRRGEQVWQAQEGVLEWTINLPRLYSARFVTIALDPQRSGGPLHLRKVKVFGPE